MFGRAEGGSGVATPAGNGMSDANLDCACSAVCMLDLKGITLNYRYLGNSGLKISEITYGNWITHGSQIENDVAVKCVHAALEGGVTSFDTADAYANGRAEEILGTALKGIRRESVEVFTKVYWPVGPKGPNDVGLSRKHVIEGLNGSLKRLGMDYVDLYQAHRYDVHTPLEETMQAFADIVRSGKSLYIGVSEWTADQLNQAHSMAIELHVPLVSNQPEYSMLWRVIEPSVIPASQELGISQIVWSPMAQGVLSGKYRPGEPLPRGSRAADKDAGAMMGRFMRDDVLEGVQKLVPVAADLGLSMSQLALSWVLQNENVASAIVGASRPDQISENVKSSGVRLSKEVMDLVDQALEGLVERNPGETLKRSPMERPA